MLPCETRNHFAIAISVVGVYALFVVVKRWLPINVDIHYTSSTSDAATHRAILDWNDDDDDDDYVDSSSKMNELTLKLLWRIHSIASNHKIFGTQKRQPVNGMNCPVEIIAIGSFSLESKWKHLCHTTQSTQQTKKILRNSSLVSG